MPEKVVFDEGDTDDCESLHVHTVLEFLFKPRRGNIVRYNARHLLHFGWLFPYRGGGVVDFHSFVLFALIIVITSIIAFFSCDNITSKVCVPLSKSPSIGNNLTLLTLSALIISFFLNNVVQRWWQTRCHIGNVISRSKTSMVNIMAVACNSVLTASATVKYTKKVIAFLLSTMFSNLNNMLGSC